MIPSGFFNSFEDVLFSYEKKQVGLHTWIWVRWKAHFTSWLEKREPLEIRIHPKGFRVEVYSGSIRIYNKLGSLVHQYIKTTPGRVLWNQAIYDVF